VTDEEYSRFYREHHGAVRAYAARRVGADGADEVAAETFTVAWRRWPQARSGGRPWLYRTASFEVSRLLRTGRRSDRLVAHLAAAATPSPTSDDDLADGVTERARVAAALLAVGPADREVLVLTAWEDLTVADLALVLGCTRTAASVRLHRARRRLRRHLDGPAPAAPTADPQRSAR